MVIIMNKREFELERSGYCYKCGREMERAPTKNPFFEAYICSKEDGGCGKPVRFCKCPETERRRIFLDKTSPEGGAQKR